MKNTYKLRDIANGVLDYVDTKTDMIPMPFNPLPREYDTDDENTPQSLGGFIQKAKTDRLERELAKQGSPSMRDNIFGTINYAFYLANTPLTMFTNYREEDEDGEVLETRQEFVNQAFISRIRRYQTAQRRAA